MTDLFTKWEKDFRTSLKGKKALRQLEKLKTFAVETERKRSADIRLDEAAGIASKSEAVASLRDELKEREIRVELLYYSLESRVLKSCYRAKCFKDNNGDRLTKLRRQDNDAIARIPEQLSAVKAIRQFIREFPRAAGWAYALGDPFGPKEPGYFWVQFLDEKEKRTAAQALDAVLAKYESGLYKPIKFGRFTHRYQYGCLHYEAPIDDAKNRPDPFTLLLYELTLFFRAFTSKKITGSFMRAVQIHPDLVKKGNPCYRIASSFAVAALGEPDKQRRSEPEHLARKRITTFLKHHPTVQYVGW